MNHTQPLSSFSWPKAVTSGLGPSNFPSVKKMTSEDWV
jgi:hypothetical protein